VVVRALDGVDLTVRRGEFIVLIGPTGCGKTTLLDIIAGLRGPDRGHVRFGDGIDRHSGLAYVFQHYTLFPWRRLLRNVEFGLEMRGMDRHQRRSLARKLLADMGLDAFENAFPHELSGGMRQRAAIAQALAIEPCILLLDEPFGALDDATRHDLQRRIIDLWQTSQRTVLFVTHNIDEAVAMGTRIVVFSGSPGNVVREIPVDLPRPRDRLSTPLPKSTATFAERSMPVRAKETQPPSPRLMRERKPSCCRLPGASTMDGYHLRRNDMPLRDHFRPPIWTRSSWEGFHGMWPAMMVQQLVQVLPKQYVAEPRVHLGDYCEIDVCAFEEDRESQTGRQPSCTG
jgi:NitT/TauT family transport system ATP-binding protein